MAGGIVRQGAASVAVGMIGFATPVLVPALHAGPAVGQFELKDLDSEPGAVEFQSQNAHSFGQPHRRIDTSDPDETLYDTNTVLHQRHALELEFGITRYLKTRIGIEYEKERLDDPEDPAEGDAFDNLKLSEAGAEVIVIFKRLEGDGFGFGAVTEYERPIDGKEASTLVMGPIVEAKFGPWSSNVNLTAVRFFGGESPRDDKWDFAYASKLAYTFSPTWTLALEAYGTVVRLGNSGRPDDDVARFGDHDQHRLGPILYYSFEAGDGFKLRPAGGSDGDGKDGAEVLIGAGALFGLNDNTPSATLKWTIEVEF
jgi:hypothetical protein